MQVLRGNDLHFARSGRSRSKNLTSVGTSDRFYESDSCSFMRVVLQSSISGSVLNPVILLRAPFTALPFSLAECFLFVQPFFTLSSFLVMRFLCFVFFRDSSIGLVSFLSYIVNPPCTSGSRSSSAVSAKFFSIRRKNQTRSELTTDVIFTFRDNQPYATMLTTTFEKVAATLF